MGYKARLSLLEMRKNSVVIENRPTSNKTPSNRLIDWYDESCII